MNGINGNVQDGSPEAPFYTVREGIKAALHNPGDDEVVILPRATAPYITPIAIVPGFSDLQVPGYSVFNGDLTIRGGGDSPDDVVIDTSVGDGICVDAPIGVTIKNLINSKQARTLQSLLKFGKDAKQTVKSLTQFQNEVRKLVNNRTLSNTAGQILIADAENLKRSVSVFATRGRDRDDGDRDNDRDEDDDDDRDGNGKGNGKGHK